MSKVFAIGDIHGCPSTLTKLYDILINDGLDPEKDIVVFLGDYIDRGPDTPAVIEQLIKWQNLYPHWKFLMGNHEHLCYDAIVTHNATYPEGTWEYNGGWQTIAQYGGIHNIPRTHMDFLFKSPVFFYETEDYFFVHGGLSPDMSIEENKEYIFDILWIRNQFINSDYDWGKKVIFGHTPKRRNGNFKPIVQPNKIGLDTAISPPAKNKLSAVRLPDETIFQARYAK